jgi:hypothetical protein
MIQPQARLVRRVRTAAVAVVLVVMAVGLLLIWPSRQVTVDERLLVPRIPSGGTNGNAVVLLDQAMSRFRSTNELRELRWARKGINPLDMEKARRIVTAESETLRLIHEAFRQPECELVVAPVWTPNDVEVPNWGALGRLAAVDAELQSNGSPTGVAWNSAWDLVRLGHRLEDCGGTDFHYRSGRVMKLSGLRLFQRWAARFQGSPEELVRQAGALAAFPANRKGLTNAVSWRFQHYFLELSNTMASATMLGASEVHLPIPLLYDPERTRSHRAKQSLALLEALGEPTAGNLAATTWPTNRFSSVRLLLRGNALGEILEDMNGLTDNSLLSTCHLENNEVSATSLILALRAFELETGELPSSLTALVPRYLDAVPSDAFDGQPLRYSREQRKIWSVGSNRVDDQGNRLDDVFGLGW